MSSTYIFFRVPITIFSLFDILACLSCSFTLCVQLGLPPLWCRVLLIRSDYSLLVHGFFPLVLRLSVFLEQGHTTKWQKTQQPLLSWAFGKERIWQTVTPSPLSILGVPRCSLASCIHQSISARPPLSAGWGRLLKDHPQPVGRSSPSLRRVRVPRVRSLLETSSSLLSDLRRRMCLLSHHWSFSCSSWEWSPKAAFSLGVGEALCGLRYSLQAP